jgi:hypothetical protein
MGATVGMLVAIVFLCIIGAIIYSVHYVIRRIRR